VTSLSKQAVLIKVVGQKSLMSAFSLLLYKHVGSEPLNGDSILHKYARANIAFFFIACISYKSRNPLFYNLGEISSLYPYILKSFFLLFLI
jgi:hypothetical protein